MCAYWSPQSNHVKYKMFYSGLCRRFSNKLSVLPFHQTEAARTKRTAANRQTGTLVRRCLLDLLKNHGSFKVTGAILYLPFSCRAALLGDC